MATTQRLNLIARACGITLGGHNENSTGAASSNALRRSAVALPSRSVAGEIIRIFSDVHFGDRASRVHSLAQLAPLTANVAALVCNGDMLDTRPGPRPDYTQELRAAVRAFANRQTPPLTLLTGNHDPDLSTQHALELASGAVLATHGDVVFPDIVPWGRDAPIIRARIAAALANPPPNDQSVLARRFAIWRSVAATIPQRHQSEPHGLKYALQFAADTMWPPLRIFHVLHAWRMHARRIGEFARVHWPAAKFILIGHTHRPGITRLPDNRVVINTGSFCPPLGGYVVDVGPESLTVRRVEIRAGEFRVGERVAEFPLAAR